MAISLKEANERIEIALHHSHVMRAFASLPGYATDYATATSDTLTLCCWYRYVCCRSRRV